MNIIRDGPVHEVHDSHTLNQKQLVSAKDYRLVGNLK